MIRDRRMERKMLTAINKLATGAEWGNVDCSLVDMGVGKPRQLAPVIRRDKTRSACEG